MSLIASYPDLLSWLGDMTLQSSLLLGLASCVMLFRFSASRRHFVLAASLVAIPVLMLGTGMGPAWRMYPMVGPHAAAWVSVSQREGPARVPAPQLDPQTTPQRGGLSSASWPLPPQGEGSGQLSAILLTAWLAGMAAGLCTLVVSAWRLRRLRARAEVLKGGRIHELFIQCCEGSVLAGRRIELLSGPAGLVPMTWGLRRKHVLLPCDAAQWTDQHVLLVLRHELAHISRHDMRVSLLTTLSSLLLWFHPLVWLVWRACNQAREAACDDLALQQSGVAAEDFASQLLSAITMSSGRSARRFAPLALAMAEADKRVLKKRLASLLDERQSRATWSRASLVSLGAAILAMVFLCTGLSACREEKKKEPAARQLFSGAQVQISSKVFSVPLASPVLAEFGFKVDHSSGLQLGVIDEKKAIALLEKLGRAPGVVFISAPNVVTKYGRKADAEVTREMIYPTEYEPPHLPDMKDWKPIQLKPGEAVPVVPTTPTAFEMRPVGLRMEFTPELNEDNTIDLTITSEYTVFEGFIDYGAPVKGSAMGTDGAIHEIVLSDSKVKQPVFHTSKWTTSVSFQNGDFLVMGGLGAKASSTTIDLKKPDLNPASLTDNTDRDLVFFVIEAKNAMH